MRRVVNFLVTAYSDGPTTWNFYMPQVKSVERDVRGLYLHSGDIEAMQTIDDSQKDILVQLLGIKR